MIARIRNGGQMVKIKEIYMRNCTKCNNRYGKLNPEIYRQFHMQHMITLVSDISLTLKQDIKCNKFVFTQLQQTNY